MRYALPRTVLAGAMFGALAVLPVWGSVLGGCATFGALLGLREGGASCCWAVRHDRLAEQGGDCCGKLQAEAQGPLAALAPAPSPVPDAAATPLAAWGFQWIPPARVGEARWLARGPPALPWSIRLLRTVRLHN